MDKLVVSIEKAAEMLDIGRTKAYQLAARSDFPTVHLGRRIVVPVDALKEWLANGGTEPREA